MLKEYLNKGIKKDKLSERIGHKKLRQEAER